MSKILELRTKRNTLWEQTKDFLEKNRGENGLVKAEAVEQYNKMAQEVKDLGAEIERLEQQAQIEAQLSAPTSSPVHHPHRLHRREDQLRPDSGDHHPERKAQLLHSFCAEHNRSSGSGSRHEADHPH